MYNASKDVRLPGEFEYRSLLFSRFSMGRILRMLLDSVWSGDRIAILPVDKWEADRGNLEKAGITHDPVNSEIQSIAFPTNSAETPRVVKTKDAYIEYNKGSVYNVSRNIDRFDTLVPLISIDPPFIETFYTEVNGKWAFVPLIADNEVPETEDLSSHFDVEGFYRNYPDKDILEAVRDEEIPETGLWVGDIIGLMEE